MWGNSARVLRAPECPPPSMPLQSAEPAHMAKVHMGEFSIYVNFEWWMHLYKICQGMITLTARVKTNHIPNNLVYWRPFYYLNWGILGLFCGQYHDAHGLHVLSKNGDGDYCMSCYTATYRCLWAVFTDTFLHASLFCGCVFGFVILLWVVGWVPRAGSEWVSRDLVAEREVKKFNMKQTHVPFGKQSKLYAHIISNGTVTDYEIERHWVSDYYCV